MANIDCSVADVLTKAMSVLGDPSGEITQEIQDDFGTTYLDLLNCLLKISSPEVTREVFFTVPPNTGVINPNSLGVTDFAEPRQIWERGGISTAPVTSTTDGTPITVTFTGLVPAAGQIELQGIQGVPDYVNRDWFITPTGASTATLNGSVACGSNGTGGNAMWSVERFFPMVLVDTRPFAGGSQPMGETLQIYKWEDGMIYIQAATIARQVWIEYLINATPPASGPISLCEGRELNFLAYGTAARFAPKRQIVQGPQIASDAYGPSGEPDGSGGMLRSLIIPIIQQEQQRPMRSGLYRRRRTPFPLLA